MRAIQRSKCRRNEQRREKMTPAPTKTARPVCKSVHRPAKLAPKPAKPAALFSSRPQRLAPVKTGLAGFQTSVARFACLVRTGLFSNQFLDLFWRGKLGEHVLDLFSSEIRPLPLYKREDHDWLSIATFNHKKYNTYPFCPTFSLLPCCLSRHPRDLVAF
jgi:hypothetical protein